MICRVCETDIPDRTEYCPKCGAQAVIEEATQPAPEDAELIPVPDDAVTKITQSKAFSAASIMSVVSALAWVVVLITAGWMLLGLAVLALSDSDEYTTVLAVWLVVLLMARFAIGAIGAAFGLNRVANSFKLGLKERQSGLRLLSRVATVVSVCQWVVLGLMAAVCFGEFYEFATAKHPKDIELGLMAQAMLFSGIHAAVFQVSAVCAKRFFNGTPNKRLNLLTAVGLMAVGAFELLNVVWLLVNLCSAGLLGEALLWVEIGLAPLFAVVAVLTQAAVLIILSILVLRANRENKICEDRQDVG